MSRHLIDHRAAPAGGRTKYFLDIEKQAASEGRHGASRDLHQRPAERGSASRITNYLRIERGRTV